MFLRRVLDFLKKDCAQHVDRQEIPVETGFREIMVLSYIIYTILNNITIEAS